MRQVRLVTQYVMLLPFGFMICLGCVLDLLSHLYTLLSLNATCIILFLCLLLLVGLDSNLPSVTRILLGSLRVWLGIFLRLFVSIRAFLYLVRISNPSSQSSEVVKRGRRKFGLEAPVLEHVRLEIGMILLDPIVFYRLVVVRLCEGIHP